MARYRKMQKVKRKRGRPPKHKNKIIDSKPELTPTLLPEIKPTTEFKPEIKKDAPQEHYFVLCNGRTVKNIKELADVMEELEDQVFNYHVTPEKNDFATWIKDIFKEIELAEKLAGAKDKKHIQLVLYKHITHKLW